MPKTKDEEDFDRENADAIGRMSNDSDLGDRALALMADAEGYRYSYQFRWMGRPIIQWPQDVVALQEIVWSVRPEVIVETGVARGGSLVFFASLLHLIGGKGEVLGIDIDIRPHNRRAIEEHPMGSRIVLIEGSSTDPATVAKVAQQCAGKKVMVVLDSNHTHDHVLAELTQYAPLVNAGSFIAVMDTMIEDFPRGYFSQRPWDKGNNPKTAVAEFLRGCDRFVIERAIDAKLLFTVAPSGYLRCIKDTPETE